MGADIYLRSKSNASCHEKWEPVFKERVEERDRLHLLPDTSADTIKQAQALVEEAYNHMHAEGYFRDSYNSSSLFEVVGASWWQLGDELLNKKSELPWTRAKKLLARFESGEFAFTEVKFKVWVDAHQNPPADKPWNTINFSELDSIENWRLYFEIKHAQWCQMLQDSINLKEPLYWSI